jgi:hypothetical protein
MRPPTPRRLPPGLKPLKNAIEPVASVLFPAQDHRRHAGGEESLVSVFAHVEVGAKVGGREKVGVDHSFLPLATPPFAAM